MYYNISISSALRCPVQIRCSCSLVLLLDLAEVRELAQHFLEADVVPLLALVAAELGQDLGDLLVLQRDHVLGCLGHVDVDVCVERCLPLNESFLHLLSTTMGSRGL